MASNELSRCTEDLIHLQTMLSLATGFRLSNQPEPPRRKRENHFPQTAAVITGSTEAIEGEWKTFSCEMMRLCDHRLTTATAKTEKWAAKTGIKLDDGGVFDGGYHKYFSVVLMEKFITLKDLARPEEWGPNVEFLRLYLDHTFRRAAELSKTRRTLMGFYPTGSEEPTHVIFNTGLLTKNVERLHALFHLNKKESETKWFLYGFQDENQLINPAKMKVYHGTSALSSNLLPERVTYHNKITDLMMDPSIPIETRVDLSHLFGGQNDFERRLRIPSKYHNCGLGDLGAKFNYALNRLKILIEAQSTIAVPQFFRDKHMNGVGEMQFICPLSLDPDNQDVVDCCIVVRRVANNAGDFYQPVTILSREMIFLHGRLVQPPTQHWLIEFMKTPTKDRTSFQTRDQQVIQPRDQQVIQPRDQQVIQPRDQQVIQPRDQQVIQPRDQQVIQPRDQQATQTRDHQDRPIVQTIEKEQTETPFFEIREMLAVVDIIKMNFSHIEQVELASLAPLLKQRIPRLKESKGLCKHLVLAAAEKQFVKSVVKGKQTYVSVPK